VITHANYRQVLQVLAYQGTAGLPHWGIRGGRVGDRRAAQMKGHNLPKARVEIFPALGKGDLKKKEGPFAHHLSAEWSGQLFGRARANVRRTQGNTGKIQSPRHIAPQCAAISTRKLAPQQGNVTRSSRTNRAAD
jgi:hypothetical protein